MYTHHLLLHIDARSARVHVLLTRLLLLCPTHGLWDTGSVSHCPGLCLGPGQRDLGNTKELKVLTSPAGNSPFNFL